MKKILAFAVLILLLIGFVGCRKKTVLNNHNIGPVMQMRIVKIDSDPQGAMVYIDNNAPITTPADIELTLGWHYIDFKKDGYEDYIIKNAEVKEDTTIISVTLVKLPSAEEMAEFSTIGPIVFDSVPHFACCSAGAIAYSNIFFGGTYTVSGRTTLDSFDIVFPLGKIVHFDTEKVSYSVRKFSKVVTFSELGEYEIVSSGNHVYSFKVDYKPTILQLTPKLEDIFTEGYKNAIAVPVGGEVEAKVLITDAKETPIPNTSLGVYGLKTDKDGIVKFKVKVVRTECPYCYKTYVSGQEAQLRVYGDLLIWGYDYAKYTKDGKLVESTTQNAKVTIQSSMLPTFKDNIEVVEEGSSVYMPYDSIGVRLNETYKGAGVGGDVILPHQKDPSVIYTNTFVSKDEGKHFEKMGETLDSIAVDPKNPNIVLGWSRFEPKCILKSTDYGLHFEKLVSVNIDLMNNFVEQIAIDPNNSNKIYLATWKGLYVSNDGGEKFSPLTNDYGIINTIAISSIDSDLILLGSEKGIVKSSDGGKTWEVMKNNPNIDFIKCIVFDPKNPNTVYAGNMYGGLLISYDSGNTWQPLYKGDLEGPQSITIIPYEETYIIFVVSFRDGIYESIDTGKTFTKLDFPVGSETNIAAGNNGLLYIIDDGIPFVKNDLGKILPLDGERFLVGGPKWKIINNRLFIDVNDIKVDFMSVDVSGNFIEFYKMCDMLP